MFSSSAAAHHQVDRAGVVGEEQRGLAGGVASADHRDRVAPQHAWPRSGRRVVDARAFEAGRVRETQPAVAGAGGDDHRARDDPRAVVDRDDVVAVVAVEASAVARDPEMRAPNLSAWIDAPLGQLRAGDPGREAEVVLDPRRRRRLSTDRDGVEQHLRNPSDAA